MRLKRYVWELLATLVDRNFKKEYTDALKFDVQLSLKNLLSHAASKCLTTTEFSERWV
jgi:hypothetical protein